MATERIFHDMRSFFRVVADEAQKAPMQPWYDPNKWFVGACSDRRRLLAYLSTARRYYGEPAVGGSSDKVIERFEADLAVAMSGEAPDPPQKGSA